MRKLFLSTTLAFLAVTAGAATVSPKPVAPAAAKPIKSFGLTQSLAVLFSCPEARFDNANVIALGGVVRENKKRIDAAPVNARMDLMSSLVAEETAKAQAYAKKHKVNCAVEAQTAAAYWNGLIASVAAEQGVETPPPVAAAASAGFKVVPRNTEPVSGLQLP